MSDAAHQSQTALRRDLGKGAVDESDSGATTAGRTAQRVPSGSRSRWRYTSVADIKAYASAGMTIPMAAKKFGIPRQVLYKRALLLGIKFKQQNRRDYVAPARAEIINAIRAGADTATQIAKVLSKSRNTVSVLLIHAETKGLVQRVPGVDCSGRGRPQIRWRAVDVEAGQ